MGNKSSRFSSAFHCYVSLPEGRFSSSFFLYYFRLNMNWCGYVILALKFWQMGPAWASLEHSNFSHTNKHRLNLFWKLMNHKICYLFWQRFEWPPTVQKLLVQHLVGSSRRVFSAIKLVVFAFRRILLVKTIIKNNCVLESWRTYQAW